MRLPIELVELPEELELELPVRVPSSSSTIVATSDCADEVEVLPLELELELELPEVVSEEPDEVSASSLSIFWNAVVRADVTLLEALVVPPLM